MDSPLACASDGAGRDPEPGPSAPPFEAAATFDVRKDRAALERAAKSPTLPHRVVMRSRIVLMLGQGHSARDVMRALSVSRRTVDLWRARYRDGGFEALLTDRPGRGRKRRTS